MLQVSIPNRDLCKLQQKIPSERLGLIFVSIPNRDLCKLQPEKILGRERGGEVSIPNRDLCKLQQSDPERFIISPKVFQSLIGICVSCNIHRRENHKQDRRESFNP